MQEASLRLYSYILGHMLSRCQHQVEIILNVLRWSVKIRMNFHYKGHGVSYRTQETQMIRHEYKQTSTFVLSIN